VGVNASNVAAAVNFVDVAEIPLAYRTWRPGRAADGLAPRRLERRHQAKVDLRSGSLRGGEALVRCNTWVNGPTSGFPG
jgi:hypothetical protein